MTRFNQILKNLAAAAFLTALAVNVKVTLTDPFVGMSEEAIAETTSAPCNSGTIVCVYSPGDFIGDCWIENVENAYCGFSFWYETDKCIEHCTPGGTHCCYHFAQFNEDE